MSFSLDYSCGISGVVDGLVCVIRYKRLSNGRTETFPVICNPSTVESLLLKKLRTSRATVRSMCYDPIDKGFKILSIASLAARGRSGVEEHQVLTLGTDKWRMLECCIPGQHCYIRKGICINGVLYYQSICSPIDINAICCFDIKSEKFRFIKFNETIPYANLINYNGNLGLLWSERADAFFAQSFDKRSTSLRLWVLEDVERQKWSKRNIMVPPLWKYVVEEQTLSVVGVTCMNEIVFESLFPSYTLYLFYLNTDKNTIVRLCLAFRFTSHNL